MTDWDFEMGETVYLKTDTEQLEGVVVERTERIGGSKLYGLACGTSFGLHYVVELTRERDPLKELGIKEMG